MNAILGSAKQYLTQRRSTQSRSFQVLSRACCIEDGTSSWVKPRESTVKVNVDAVIFPEHGYYGAGMVVRDQGGSLFKRKQFD